MHAMKPDHPNSEQTRALPARTNRLQDVLVRQFQAVGVHGLQLGRRRGCALVNRAHRMNDVLGRKRKAPAAQGNQKEQRG